MVKFVLKADQNPSEGTLKRLAELKDEDIVYDEDCPELTSEQLKEFKRPKKSRRYYLKEGRKA